jgi:hypothetical protein
VAYVKVYAFIPRRQDISSQAFHDHWRHPHATWGKQMRNVRRYVQNHQLVSQLLGPEQNRYDGIAEAWFETAQHATAFSDDPAYRKYIGPDEAGFIDGSRLTYLAVTEEVLSPTHRMPDADRPDTLWSPWDVPLAIKLFQIFLPGRKDAWSLAGDGELGNKLRALRHTRCYPIDALSPPEGVRFVGLRELWWPTLSAFAEGVSGSRDAWSELCGRQQDTLTILTQSELGRNDLPRDGYR